ncbi:hypothetical protein F4780DRAFT_756740 [Xylariomycetidae sp. FL0641]|nr:hypothetical protein F4780DRAFT_756740 [Xylariomycetidae sp. FL0641]
MGIQGLLPLLNSIQRPTELKKFAGQTLGIDGYGWLHRGAVSCAIELAEGKPTRKYVDAAMHRVRMLKHFGVNPYLVFDGGFLPSKSSTESSRSKRRDESRKTGLELLKAGKPSQAYRELQKAIDVTPEMARLLIEELKKAGIPYVVAPYEADAQLVYLEQQGYIAGILSEDSDLLVFGAKRLLTKLDKHGQCVEINRRDFASCRGVSFTGWTDAQFRHMAIFSGCDYLDGIHNCGLKTAHRMVRKYKTPDRVIRGLQFDDKFRVPADYPVLFKQAEQTFLYQWVFCPKAKELVHLNPLPEGLEIDELPFIGPHVLPELARQIALGDFNPITNVKIEGPRLSPPLSPRKRTASASNHNTSAPLMTRKPPPKPIDSYFKGHRRVPMGEMDPNCFSVDPDRSPNATEDGDRPLVFPLPRPYLDEPPASLTASSRNYINRASNPHRTLRRRTEPIYNILSDDGRALGSNTRRQTTGPPLQAVNGPNTNGAANGARPPKKARLCDDTTSSSSPGKQKSRFFGSHPTTSKNNDGYLLSDESMEEALKELPDVDGWQTPAKGEKTITVYNGKESQDSTGVPPKDDERSDLDIPSTATTSETEAVVPDTPPKATLSRYSYVATEKRAESDQRKGRRTSLRKGSLFALTPASSVDTPLSSFTSMSSLSQATTAKTTPGTPRLTPLQRIGARALKQPSTPTFTAPRAPKRSSLGRMSLDSFPVNPAFVPLPPVDLDEVEALHKPMGSEDLLVPESENEDVIGNSENLGGDENKKPGPKMNLSRFLFA